MLFEGIVSFKCRPSTCKCTHNTDAKKTKKVNSHEGITWSEMGKQNIPKGVYSSRRGTFYVQIHFLHVRLKYSDICTRSLYQNHKVQLEFPYCNLIIIISSSSNILLSLLLTVWIEASNLYHSISVPTNTPTNSSPAHQTPNIISESSAQRTLWMSYTLLLIWSSIGPGYKTLTLACKFTRRNTCRFKWSEHETSPSPKNRRRRPLFFFSLVVWLENFLVFSLVWRNLWQTAIYTWQKECHLFYSLYKISKCTKCLGSLFLCIIS